MAEDLEDLFSLTLRGDGISIEKEIDKQTALAVVAAVMGETVSPANVQPAREASRANGGVAMSIGEFLTETTAETSKERIVAIGLYLREHKDQDTFTKDDVSSGFRSAHEPLPKNLSRDFSNTIKVRWIAQADESGRYYVTSIGAKAVKSCFGRQRPDAH